MDPSATQPLSSGAEKIDVERIIDAQPFTALHLRVTLLCALSVLLDGFDAQVIGFVAPAIARQWHVPRAELGPILSAGLAGMLFGSLVFGPLADRIGRKRVLVLCTLWFGVFSLLTATAHSVESMILLRLATGFGLGGTLPNAISLTAEYMPKRLRATGVMIMFSGFSIGAALGGLLAAGLIEKYGWPSIFVVGGILPCLTALLLAAMLPESIRFLVLKGGEEPAVAKLLRRIAPQTPISPASFFTVPEHRESGFPVKRLFTEGRTPLTLLLWVIFFMSLLDLYFMNSWLPTVLHDSGIKLEQAIVITSMFQFGGALGSLLLGRTIDRLTSYRALVWAYLGASLCVFLVGMTSASVPLETLAVFLAGFCVIGAQTGANSLAAESYPTGMRSTGSGWALGIGRIGSITGPVAGGLLLSSQLQVRRVFWVAAVPSLIAALAALAVRLPRSSPIDPQN